MSPACAHGWKNTRAYLSTFPPFRPTMIELTIPANSCSARLQFPHFTDNAPNIHSHRSYRAARASKRYSRQAPPRSDATTIGKMWPEPVSSITPSRLRDLTTNRKPGHTMESLYLPVQEAPCSGFHYKCVSFGQQSWLGNPSGQSVAS